MKYILPLILFLFTLLPAEAVKKFDINPINIAVVLVEKADTTNIKSMLDYYGYTYQAQEDGYQVMRNSNGNEISVSFNNESANPIIKVKPRETQKDINEILKELKFIKTGSIYERTVNRYKDYVTQCSFELRGALVFKRIQR